MVVVCGLPLKVAMTILELIFSMLLTDRIAIGLRRMPTPPMVELVEFFHAEADIKVQPLPQS